MFIENTFVQVSTDCPAKSSVVPVAKGDKKPVHLLQYELLAQNPYTYTLDDLIFEVHVRHKEIPEEDVKARRDEIWAELFAKNHPCMRASMLPKKYGWGVHYDSEGKIAIYPMESEEYRQFVNSVGESVKLVFGMRSKR
jgi:hypothetical protein